MVTNKLYKDTLCEVFFVLASCHVLSGIMYRMAVIIGKIMTAILYIIPYLVLIFKGSSLRNVSQIQDFGDVFYREAQIITESYLNCNHHMCEVYVMLK